MARTGRLLLAFAIIAQVGCASRGDPYAEGRGPPSEWTCRVLDSVEQHPIQTTPNQAGVDAGAAALVLVVWPVLAGACLASRL